VLGDSARFAGSHPRLADRIHQRRLSVVHMAHESDDRAADPEFFFLLDNRGRRRDDDLLYFMNASAFFATLHLETKPCFWQIWVAMSGSIVWLTLNENV